MKKWKWDSGTDMNLQCYRFYFSSITGKNAMEISVDTPYANYYFGNYYIKVPVRIIKQKLNIEKMSTYKISAEWKNHKYELKKGMTLYTSTYMQNAESFLSSGTQFYVLEVQPVSLNSSSGSLYVKIKTISGKVGWLYFPEYSKINTGYLKEVPS